MSIDRTFTVDTVPSQRGRTMVVTGANAGLGLIAAEALARAGARVVLACRNQVTGRDALEKVGAASTGEAPILVPVDLGDLGSVREAAARITDEVDAIDVLINNAGIMAVPLRRTPDGFESQIGTNHLGHFALTGALLPRLLAAPAPRVVTLASIAHRQGILDLQDLNFERRRYNKHLAYGQSKLANLLFSAELARRAEAAGLPLLSVAAHPGVSATNLFDAMTPRIPGARPLMHAGLRVVGNPPRAGAASQVYAATMPDVRNDDYLGPSAFFGVRGPVERCGRTRAARSRRLASGLWDLSVQLTGQTFDALEPAAR
ncbi:MAG TPA: oxidoreductase [Nocardioidaceae bacterium]|nr:oxidoreductase [Nocardioidaceae bacterium]